MAHFTALSLMKMIESGSII